MYENHGTMKTYRKGCTCNLCRAANALYQKQYQQKRKEKIKGAELEKSSDKTTATQNP